MGLKLFTPGGIDQKSSDLVRNPSDLRDARNIKLSTNKEYIKRDGTDLDIAFSGDTYSDIVFIKSLNEYFFRNGFSYYSYKQDPNTGVIGSKVNISKSSGEPTTVNTSLISGAEYLNTFIFTHTDGQSGTFKYDGNCIYKAGLPAPEITITSQSGAAVDGYMLNFFDYIDNQGNEIFGPAKITKLTNTTAEFDVNTLKSSGFYEGYVVLANLGIGTGDLVYSLTEINRSIIVTAISPDIKQGTKIAFRNCVDRLNNVTITDTSGPSPVTYSGYKYALVEVESVVGFVVTFTAASMKNKIIGITVKDVGSYNEFNIMTNTMLRTYYSLSETTGYTQGYKFSTVIDENYSINNHLSSSHFVFNAHTENLYLLSNIYDITTSKLRPPKCKYILAYGDQIACGNVLSFWDFQNKETNYTNNDLVMYSDVQNGDLGESFSEINRQLIGNTFDGQVTGLTRSNNSLIVFKERSVYSLDGVLLPGQYSRRKIETNEIGCLHFKSILQVDSMTLFHGQDGIYSVNGYKCEKVTDKLDPFFVNLNGTLTRSVVDNNNDQYLFFTRDGVVVYNYMYGHWFIWDGLDASCGAVCDNTLSRVVRMFRSDICTKFNSDKYTEYDSSYKLTLKDFNHAWIADNLLDKYLPINAWIKTHWFDLAEPSLLKKIVDIRFFSLKNLGQTLYSQLFHDWDELKNKSQFSIDLSSNSKKTILRKLDIQQAQSFSFIIGNNNIDEDLNLSGYEVNCTIIQDKDKNV